ncbi:MAG: hypothetical protein O3C28_12560 [Proteobacteria bacterium]|nr:hypothetical protein [Pseudomonadota bacterium]
MSIQFLDPTHESHFGEFTLAPKLKSLESAVVAIISNGKKGSIPFFDAFAEEIRVQYKVAEVVRITKFNYSTPVDASLLDDAQRWNALITGIGD